MRITVTDACIFIDLLECQAYEAFFQLSFKVVTSYQVWMELDKEHREILEKWVESEQLTIIKIKEDFVQKTQNKRLSSSLSVADLSVWYIADENENILLTSDGTLRTMAKRHEIKTHGLLWIFDQLFREDILSPKELISKLQHIFDINVYYRTNSKLYNAFKRMKKKWEQS